MAAAMPHRESMMSISTVSTKLGEIPERRRLRRPHNSSSESADSGPSTDITRSQYNVLPTYPLKPYREAPEAKSKGGGFWGFFRR
jgi:hypothetical protein